LNIGLENSRRFRALPVYAVLLAYGREGLAEIFARQVRLARLVSGFLDSHQGYELLAQSQEPNNEGPFSDTHIIVLFRAKDDIINRNLVKNINSTRKMFVSGTTWNGSPACRIAVSTWEVDVEGDLGFICRLLEEALK